MDATRIVIRLGLVALLGFSVLSANVSCSGPANGTFVGSVPSADAFPPVGAVLEVHCGTLDCHGSSARNVRVYSIDGLRLDPRAVTGDQGTTPEETMATYESLIAIQPEVLSRIVDEHGARPERWIAIAKARGLEEHKGGTRMKQGDDTDRCITSWLAGAVDTNACSLASIVMAPGGEGF